MGRLGLGDYLNRNKPIKINISNIIQVSAGGFHSLILNDKGVVYFFGQNGVNIIFKFRMDN